MIERIIEVSARNKFLVFVCTLFAIAGGIYGLMKTPLDAVPDLSDVQVIITTDWEGRAPESRGGPGHVIRFSRGSSPPRR